MWQSHGSPMPSAWLIRTRFLVLPILGALCAAISSPAIAQQGVQIDTDNGLVSVQANNTTANELAAALADALGISVVITGDTETLVNIDIIEEPLEKALAKLDPNNMLVRADSRPGSEIIEVVLLLGDDNNTNSGASQFLPSGSPADEVITLDAQNASQDDESALFRHPKRTAMIQKAVETASDQFGNAPQPVDLPAGEMFDPATGLPIDPVTGQPLQSE